MKNKPLIAANLECRRKQMGLTVLAGSGPLGHGRGQRDHRWRLESRLPWSISGRTRKKVLQKYVRSRNLYENKGTPDTVPEKNRTFMYLIRTFSSNRGLFCRKLRLLKDSMPNQFGFSRYSSRAVAWIFPSRVAGTQIEFGRRPNGSVARTCSARSAVLPPAHGKAADRTTGRYDRVIGRHTRRKIFCR